MAERHDPAELAAALRVDRALDDLLAGAPPAAVDLDTGALLERLARAHGGQPPASVRARVAAAVRRAERRWLHVQAAAAVLALLLLGQGAGNLLAGPWVARNLHVPFDSHAFVEGGILLLALGGVVLAGALARRWIGPAVAAGAPVGLAFAVRGSSELAEFPAGGVLHLSQGLAAVALAALWWRARRYGFAPGAKRGHGT